MKKWNFLSSIKRIGFLSLMSSLLILGACNQRGGKAGTDIVATVGSRNITAKELNSKVSAREYQFLQQIYKLKKAELDKMLSEIVLEAEAKKEGISSKDLLKKEVYSKVEEVTPKMVDQYYQQNKKYFPPNLKMAELKSQIGVFLKAEKEQRLYNSYVNRLKMNHQVKIKLSPPDAPIFKVEIGDAPTLGKADAPVTVVEFSDFQCPYCRRAQSSVKQVEAFYGDRVKFVFKNFPLSFHPKAKPAAIAALCAQEQGKFWEYKRLLFETDVKLFNKKTFARLAKQLQLPEKEFVACLDSGKMEQRVAADIKQGQQLGVSGTPAFFINGRMLSGAQPFNNFKDLIDRGLAEEK